MSQSDSAADLAVSTALTPPATSENLPADLTGWLGFLEALHPANIELNLDRVKPVYQRMALEFGASVIVTVAGTNGKGSTCRFIEQVALAHGKTCGVYSSPHLLSFRERVRINNALLSEGEHCDAFAFVEGKREGVALTFFEFATLAALYLLSQNRCDLLLLEVGLGGRLDAVNVVDPDIAVITTIDLDHQDWLGDTRELIAREKAGILRAGIPAVIADTRPPESLLEALEIHQCDALINGIHFAVETAALETPQVDVSAGPECPWSCRYEDVSYGPFQGSYLPKPSIAAGIAVWHKLPWPFDPDKLRYCAENTQLSGRFQQIASAPTTVLDVAHNPQATGLLWQRVSAKYWDNLHLVVGMLSDKDSQSSLQNFVGKGANWYVAPLDTPRSADVETLKSALPSAEKVLSFANIGEAVTCAQAQAQATDMIVIFGSFYTVAAALKATGNSDLV